MADALESITRNDELEDGDEHASFTLARIDTRLLTSPAVLQSAGGIAIGVAFLAWPNRTDRIVARVIGLALMWLAIVAIRAALGSRPRNKLSVALAAVTLVIGAVLVFRPDRSTVFLARLLGVVLAASALHSIYRLLRAARSDPDVGSEPENERAVGQDPKPGPAVGPDLAWARLAINGLTLAVGLTLVVVTDEVIGIVIAVGAIVMVSVSALTLMISLDARTDGTASYRDTAHLLLEWLRERPKSVDARQSLYDKILYEGPTTRTRVIRFFTLMGFAAVIASMGVLTDSTAVVIGAMLVAPLMTPLMGMAISLVMGWPNRLARSAAIAAGGIGFAILIGVLLGLIMPAAIDTAANSQIVSRSSPTILDLVTAVAAGAAGAYGLSRPDVSDSLPGVAIAIALVPPLSVVGISYSQADWSSGNGALLLFATNMVAILLVGGLTFILTGVTPLVRVAESQHRVRTALLVTCTAAVLVIGALLLNGAQIATNTFEQSTVDDAVDTWLEDGPLHRQLRASIDGSTVTAVVIGPSEGLPEPSVLADLLAEELDRTVTVDVSLVVEERLRATSE